MNEDNKLVEHIERTIISLVNTSALSVAEKDYKVQCRAYRKTKPEESWVINVNRQKKVLTICYPLSEILDLSYAGFLDSILSTIARRRYLRTTDHAIEKVHSALSIDSVGSFPPLAKMSLGLFTEICGKRKMMEEFPGTYDPFKESVLDLDKSTDESTFEDVSEFENYFLNIERVFWNLPIIGATDQVEESLIKTLAVLDELNQIKSGKKFVQVFLQKVWPIIKGLLDEGSDDGGSSQAQYNSMSEMKEELVMRKALNNQESTEQPEEGDESESTSTPKEGDEPPQGEAEGQGEADNEPAIDGDKIKTLREVATEGMSEPSTKLDNSDQINGRNKKESCILDENLNPIDKNMYDFSYDEKYWDLKAEVQNSINFFKRKLGSVLRDNRLSRQGGGYRSGHLTKNKLYKVKTKNPKVFTRKIRRQNKDYGITMLVDVSGSMKDPDLRQAGLACIMLSEVLSNVGIDFEIISFDDELNYLKTFDHEFNWSIKRNLEILSNGRLGGGTTFMGLAVNEAAHRLMTHETDKRILILITDGEPNSANHKVPDHIIRRLERQGSSKRVYKDFDPVDELNVIKKKMVVIGIGIGSYANYINDLVEDSKVIKDVSELPLLILTKIKKYIRRK